jgi:hypothetical protein
MCAHVAPWEIANKNSKSARFDDRREKLKNGGNIAGQESAIFGSGRVKILSRANCVARVRSGSQSFQLKKGLVDLIKECRMAIWSQSRVRMSYPLVGGGGSRFGVAPRSRPPPEVKRGEIGSKSKEDHASPIQAGEEFVLQRSGAFRGSTAIHVSFDTEQCRLE